jgi:hypothetical protein
VVLDFGPLASVRFRPIADISRLGDAASVSAHPKTSTLAFYVAFALWFTAMSYSGPGFYAWQLAPIVQDVLGLAMFGVFFVVAVLVVRRSLRRATFPWLDIAVVAGAIVGFEVVWRFCRTLAWDAFKLASLGLDISTPLIFLLGLIAVSAELGLFRSKSHQAAM